MLPLGRTPRCGAGCDASRSSSFTQCSCFVPVAGHYTENEISVVRTRQPWLTVRRRWPSSRRASAARTPPLLACPPAPSGTPGLLAASSDAQPIDAPRQCGPLARAVAVCCAAAACCHGRARWLCDSALRNSGAKSSASLVLQARASYGCRGGLRMNEGKWMRHGRGEGRLSA